MFTLSGDLVSHGNTCDQNRSRIRVRHHCEALPFPWQCKESGRLGAGRNSVGCKLLDTQMLLCLLSTGAPVFAWNTMDGHCVHDSVLLSRDVKHGYKMDARGPKKGKKRVVSCFLVLSSFCVRSRCRFLVFSPDTSEFHIIGTQSELPKKSLVSTALVNQEAVPRLSIHSLLKLKISYS